MKNDVTISAHIFAAGLGTRLKPLTDEVPKPLVKVHNTPLLFYCINFLESTFSPQKITINTFHLAEKFSEIKLPQQTTLYKESQLKGNGIAMLRWPEYHKNSTCIVAVNGDSIFNDSNNLINKALSEFLNIPSSRKIGIITQKSKNSPLLVSSQNSLLGIKKKDGGDFFYSDNINQEEHYRTDAAGIYFFTPQVIPLIKNLHKTEDFIGFYGEKDLMQTAIQQNWEIKCFPIENIKKYEVTTIEDYNHLNSIGLGLNYAIKN